MRLSVRKRAWVPGKYQVLLYIRYPDGSEVCTQGDKFDENIGKWAQDLTVGLLRKLEPRTFWERILSICSMHRNPDPDCAMCQANPDDLFPDWADATAQAEVSGETVCKKCGFTFYRTVTSCPACNHPAVPPLAEAMTQAEEALASEDLTKTKASLEAMYFYIRHILGRFRRNVNKSEEELRAKVNSSEGEPS